MNLVILPDATHAAEDFPVDAAHTTALWKAEEQHFWHRARNQWIVDALRRSGLEAGASVLEVGCGSGIVVMAMQDAGFQVTGVDTAEVLLRKGVDRCPGARFVCGDVAGLPPELQGPYDALALFDLIEHLDDPRPLMNSALRWLAPGGLVVVTVPAMAAYYSDIDAIWGHKLRYDVGQLESLLQSIGLEGVSEHGIFRAVQPLMRRARRSSRAVSEIEPGERDQILERSLRVPLAPINGALRLVCAVERALFWNRSAHRSGCSLMGFGRKPLAWGE